MYLYSQAKVHIFFIFWNNLKTDRIWNMKVQEYEVTPLAVILRLSLKRLDQYASSIAQPMSREVTFFWSQAFFQLYCVTPHSKCAWCTTNRYKSNEMQQYPSKKVPSRAIGWAKQHLDCSNRCKVGRKITGGTRSFTIVGLARFREVFVLFSVFELLAYVLTQDFSWSCYSFQQPAL